ncbi:hypothetical protein [Novosphingobium sp. Gsoil 351]|nr:hypothetical protein [Novosphingobium sp. Gsoil 351]
MLGPLSVALLTDDIFADPTRIGWSFAAVAATVQPISIAALLLAVRRSA